MVDEDAVAYDEGGKVVGSQEWMLRRLGRIFIDGI